MLHAFDLPLVSSLPAACGTLRITYNEDGFLHADYHLANWQKLPDRLYNTMLYSTMFAPVMEQIEAAIENNRQSLILDHNQTTLS